MAKIVIAGSSNCPYYARIELLADHLAKNLPSFKLTKIVKSPEDWENWARQFCEERGWHRYKSPIVWRELVNQGGKGVLIGGANEFQEYVKAYYNCESALVSPQQLAVASDNARYKADADAELAALRAKSRPLKVVVTEACGPVAYHLLPLLAGGSVFGADTEVVVTLFDRLASEAMEGLAMEAEDLAEPLLRSVRRTSSLSEALAGGVDLLVLLDELPSGRRESRADWLARCAERYREYAAAVCAAGCGGPAGVRILVSGRAPVNFGARILLETDGLRRRPPHPDRVAASPRLQERWAKGAVAAKIGGGAPPAGIHDLVVWGDPAAGHLRLDLSRSSLSGHEESAVTGPPDWYRRPLAEVLWDADWARDQLPRQLVKRQADFCGGGDGVSANVNSIASLARATADTLRDWWLGQAAGGGVTSLGIASKGWYGIPEGTVFCFPVRFQPSGAWSVVEDFDLPEEALQRLRELAELSQKDYELGTGKAKRK